MTVSFSGGGGAKIKKMTVSHEVGHLIDGGTFTAGAWQTRTLNTLSDPDGISGLSGNQFLLPKGDYIVNGFAFAWLCQKHQVRLVYSSSGAVVILGSTHYASTAPVVPSDALLNGSFSLAAAAALEIQQRCQATYLNSGWGDGSTLDLGANNVFASFTFSKVG